MASHYNLRKKEKTNYQEVNNVILPRPVRSNNTSKLYAITIVEEDGERVKVHYEGYDDKYDEWKDKSEIVDPSPVPEKDIYQPFELHRELAIQIKMALDSKHRRDPEVRIELSFDRLLFKRGIKSKLGIWLLVVYMVPLSMEFHHIHHSLPC